jgi:hypothetical protein
MSNKEKWLGKNLIFFAGVVSFLSTFFGCTTVLGLLWMQYTPKSFIPSILLVAEFPLFLLATFVSKRFIIPLWAIAFIYPLAFILLARDIFIANSFMMFMLAAGTISFAFTAALLQYGGVSSPPHRKNLA